MLRAGANGIISPRLIPFLPGDSVSINKLSTPFYLLSLCCENCRYKFRANGWAIEHAGFLELGTLKFLFDGLSLQGRYKHDMSG
jgi:hypothetical protein